MAGVLSVNLEIVEPRTRYERQAATIVGYDWDLYLSSNVAVDPVTKTAFLLPVPLTDEWQTTTTGAYARMQKNQYALATGTAWTSFDRNGLTGNTYLHALSTNETVYSGSAMPKNAPVFLSWYAYNAGNSRFVQMECGWGTIAGNVSLRFWSDNSVEVWRNGVYVSNGNLTDNESYPSYYGDRRGADGGVARQNAQETVDVLMIPTRGNEIIIYSPTTGGGFNASLVDVDPDEANITPADKFWWKVPEGQATVQMQAPMGSRTGGTVYSLPYYMRYPPITGDSPEIVGYLNLSGFGSAAYTMSVVDADSLAAFVPNDVLTGTRLKIVLSGDGYASPFFYGGVYAYPGNTENTTGGTINITSYVLARETARLEVGEDPSSVMFSFLTKTPDALEGTVPSAAILGNRPFEARSGTVAFITGRTNAPKRGQKWSDDASTLAFECQDRWKAFEHYLIADPEPLDGTNIGSVFAYFAGLPGYPDSDIDIEYMDFSLPVVVGASQGEWAVIPQVGDTVAQWIQRLYQDFAANMYVGWRPTVSGPKFCVYGTATLGTAAAVTLYSTVAAAGGTLTNVYRSFDEIVLEPEANDIYAFGQDRRTKLPIVAHYTDAVAINPTTAPASRPDRWLGEKYKYSLIAPEIVTQETANWCVGVLASRLAVSRRMAEWRSDFLFKSDNSPVWRGDVVKLDGEGRYRVNTISAEFRNEWGTVSAFRECVYTGERIGD